MHLNATRPTCLALMKILAGAETNAKVIPLSGGGGRGFHSADSPFFRTSTRTWEQGENQASGSFIQGTEKVRPAYFWVLRCRGDGCHL